MSKLFYVVAIRVAEPFEIVPYFHGTAGECKIFDEKFICDAIAKNERRIICESTEEALRIVVFDFLRNRYGYKPIFDAVRGTPMAHLRAAFLIEAHKQLDLPQFSRFVEEFGWMDIVTNYLTRDRIEDMNYHSYPSVPYVLKGPYSTEILEADKAALLKLWETAKDAFLVCVYCDPKVISAFDICVAYLGRREKCAELENLLHGRTGEMAVFIAGDTTEQVLWRVIVEVLAKRSKFRRIFAAVLASTPAPDFKNFTHFLHGFYLALIQRAIACGQFDQFMLEARWYVEIMRYLTYVTFEDLSGNECRNLKSLLDEFMGESEAKKVCDTL